MKLHHPMIINVVRVLQLIAALITCGLCAWSVTWYGVYAGYVVAWWSGFWTVVFMFFRCLEHCAKHNFFHLIAMGVEGVVVLSWLVSTALLGVLNQSLGRWETQWEQQINVLYNGQTLDTVFTNTGRASLKGSYVANGLAAGLFISFLITLGTYIHTYRKAKQEQAKGPNMSHV